MLVMSLGTDCLFKTYMTELGYKKRRSEGEKTYPFDLAIHPYSTMLYLLQHGFKNYICDDDMYENEEGLLCNRRWNTVFVHESNHFKDVAYVEDCWKQETLSYNFIDHNFLELKKRYNRRIKDFKEMLERNKDDILFCYHTKNNEHCAELYQHIKQKFPKSYLFVLNTHHEPIYQDRIHDTYYYINCPLPNGELWNTNNKNAEIVKTCLNTITELIIQARDPMEETPNHQEVDMDSC